MSFEILMITTFINHTYIKNLINSILDNNKGVKVGLICINQTNEKLLPISGNEWTIIFESYIEKSSLSFARNCGIEYLLENKFHSNFVMFPDDDTTFSVDFFNNYQNSIQSKSQNYVIDVYGENSKDLYLKNNVKHNSLISKDKPKIAMSVNMLMSFESFIAIGKFDEKVGVGTYYGAGEDIDYFFRVVQKFGPFLYLKSLWNFHPKYEEKHNTLSLSSLITKYRNYGRGMVYVYMKHKKYGQAIVLCFSALAGSIVEIFKLNLKLSIARLFAFYYRFFTLLSLINNRK